jgi:hypothetical protein
MSTQLLQLRVTKQLKRVCSQHRVFQIGIGDLDLVVLINLERVVFCLSFFLVSAHWNHREAYIIALTLFIHVQ